MDTNNVIYFQEKKRVTGKKSKPRVQASEKGKALNEEYASAFNAVIDAVMNQTVMLLKRMDREDAEIIIKELNASILRVARATQLAKMSLQN